MCAAAFKNTVSLFKEMVAYETLLAKPKETMTTISEKFKARQVLPSELLETEKDLFTDEVTEKVVDYMISVADKCKFSVCVNGDFQYPDRLREAKHPIELFYYRGDLGLLDSRCVSVVGSRKCSDAGLSRARKIARGLVDHDFTIVSGLAAGVDTAAMSSAIEAKGRTIGVIGTPINNSYPKENRELQERVAENYLLISQVPFYRYANEPFASKRYYFPQRNETMSAISEATVIIEASDTSGTLTQARACIDQGRKLFILKSIVEDKKLNWPRKYLDKGARQVNELDEILKYLGAE